MFPHPDPHPNLKLNLLVTGTPCQPPPTAWTLRAPVLFLLQQLEGDVGNESGSVGGGISEFICSKLSPCPIRGFGTTIGSHSQQFGYPSRRESPYDSSILIMEHFIIKISLKNGP